MAKKSMMEYMKSRNSMQLRNSDEPKSKGLTKTKFENRPETEAKERKYSKTPTAKYEGSQFEEGIKKDLRDKYSKRDSDVKNTIEKSKMKGEINYLRNREKQLGGKKSVDKKIRKEKRKKVVKDLLAPAVAGAGVATVELLKKQFQKKEK